MNDALTPLPYLYTAYGLTLASAFPCPQVPSGAGCPEVALRYGPVPPDLDSAAHHGDGSAVTPTQALIQVPGIGRYLVSAGREVVIEPAPHSSVEAIQALVFGPACGALLHQRGVLVLHGSAMATPYGAVVFVGRSGEGKSTLAAAFYQRGYQLLADDVCAVLPTHATTPQLFPALPRLRLWADAVARFGWTAMELPRVHPAIEKYALPLPATFPTHPFPLAAVYELETGPDRTIHLTSLQGAHKLAVLLRHTYRAWWLPGMGKAVANLQQCLELSRQIRVGRILRPREPGALEALMDRLEDDMAHCSGSPGAADRTRAHALTEMDTP